MDNIRLEKNQLDLYVLMGQSNMAGRGTISDSLRLIQHERVLMLARDLNWVVARHPVHFDKPDIAGVGPGLSFGIAMAEMNPGVKIGLVPCAVGGTSIDKWQPGAFDHVTTIHPYDDAVLRIKEAMKHGKVKGVVWLQGEGDSNEKSASRYLENLEMLIRRIRELTGEKNLPVIAGELGRFKPNYRLINTELHKLPELVSHASVVSSEGLTDKGDKTHFDAKSAGIYGIRFAREMQRLLERPDRPEELKLNSAQIGQLKVLGEDAGEIFHRILLDRLKSQFDKRRENLKKACESKEAMLSRQAQLRKAYLRLLGEFPERTPLNPLITGKLDCGNYTIEKIVFESRPDFHVTGNFYLPKQRTDKIPGIYMMSGHSDAGKAAETYHTAATLFALNGFAVLITDPVCQGERFQKITVQGKQAVPGLTLNHTLLDLSSMLAGTDIVTYELWDNIRGLDYLAGRPEVDGSGLGITGNSGGGTQTVYLAAFDKRVKAAAPSCYIASFETKFKTIGSQDGCQQLHDEGLAGLEEQDLLFLAAPTPVRILSAEQDFFAFGGAQKASLELKKMYSILGFPENTDQVHYPGPHGFARPLREAAVSWMKRWLMNDTIQVKELENMKLLMPADLTVTSSGQILSAFPDERTVTDINIEKLNESCLSRQAFLASVSEKGFKEKVKSLLRMEEWEPKQVSVSLKGSFMLSGKRVEKLIVSRPGGCPLPVLLFYPERTSDESRNILLVDDHGKAGELKQGGIIEAELEKRNLVFSIDLSGYGELRYKNGKYRNDEFWNANLALYNGKPMFTWLVEDLICGVEGIKVHFPGMKRKIELLAKGDLCPAALHAAVLCDQIDQVTLLKPTISSWEEVVKNPYTIKNGYAFLVPGVLSYYDLPDMKEFSESPVIIK